MNLSAKSTGCGLPSWRTVRLIGLQSRYLRVYGPTCKFKNEGQEETKWILKPVMP